MLSSGILRSVTPAEQKIVDLSAKVIAVQGTAGFEPALEELRQAIHEHINRARDGVADLAFQIASISDSKAAD